MNRPNFGDKLELLYEEVVVGRRLAHVVGSTVTRDVAVFSQLPDFHEMTKMPRFLVVHAAAYAGGAFAHTHRVLPGDTTWHPGLGLELVVDELRLVIPHGHAESPVLVSGLPLTPAEHPPVPIHQLPATEAGLLALLRTEGGLA